MALATFKDLCLDANDAQRLGSWWSAVLGLGWDPTEVAHATGPTPQHTIWFARVPERKTVKHRVHFDIYTRSLDDLQTAGATVAVPQQEGWGWTVMTDPEGGEFCAFVRDELPPDRLHGLGVDCAEPAALAQWWAEVYDADLTHDDDGYWTVARVPGMPILTMDFSAVPEPKTVKNRIHWGVTAPDVDALQAKGAAVLRHPDDDIAWTVMADPEGNEFCAFAPPE
jgi:hypothetical protein